MNRFVTLVNHMKENQIHAYPERAREIIGKKSREEIDDDDAVVANPSTGILHRGPWAAGVLVLAGALLLGSCATSRRDAQIALSPGAPWHEVVKTGGKPTVIFSYVTGGRKYDLATLENSASPVVFENSRLFAVLPPEAITEFDRRIAEHLKTVELPFEKGVGEFHAWVLVRRAASAKPTRPAPTTAGDVAEAAATGAILTPIAPFLLAGGVCYATEYAMTGGDRTRAQQVNEGLLASGPSYTTFLSQFAKYDFHTAQGSYQIREYLATGGAFFTGRDFYYEVGLRNGKPLWVTYRNNAVRSHAVRYWSAHR